MKLPAGKLFTLEVPPLEIVSETPQIVPAGSFHVTVYGGVPPNGDTFAEPVLSP